MTAALTSCCFSVQVEFSQRALDDMAAMKTGGLALRVLRGWDDVRGAIEQVCL